jgi:hypothetical protein
MNTTLRHRQNRMREAELSKEEEFFHPVVKNVARAISDWHSERDWLFQTDDSNEPKAKSPDLVEAIEETKFSSLYF